MSESKDLWRRRRCIDREFPVLAPTQSKPHDKPRKSLRIFELSHVPSSLSAKHHASLAARTAAMIALRRGCLVRQGTSQSFATRSFSVSASRNASWGFIGLGAMGRYNQHNKKHARTNDDQAILWRRTCERRYLKGTPCQSST